jgi:hypothetical protein
MKEGENKDTMKKERERRKAEERRNGTTDIFVCS